MADNQSSVLVPADDIRVRAQVVSDEEEFVVEEIVVTARKRAQRIQEVPMSITAISEIELDRQGIFDFTDYAVTVPNLSFTFGGASGQGENQAIAIRGIFGDGTTGFYIDETPTTESVDIRIVDVNRIEVLRGPQGTLYGARSMGGTVRVIMNQPNSQDFEVIARARGSGTAHGDENFGLEGVLNIPIVRDKLAVRMIAFYEDETGVQDRKFGPIVRTGGFGDFLDFDFEPQNVEKDVDDRQIAGAHITAQFTPNEVVTITPKVIYQREESNGIAFSDIRPDNFVQVRDFDIPEPHEDELQLYTLTMDFEKSWGTVTSNTAYFHRNYKDAEDITDVIELFFGLPDPFPVTITSDAIEKIVTQEIRFASSFGGRFQFVGGGFFENREKSRTFFSLAPGFDEFFAQNVIGLPPGTGFFGTDLFFTRELDNQDIRELAVFGELSIDVTPKLTVSAGVRYFDNQVDFDRISDGIINGGRTEVHGVANENGFTPKFSIDYELNEDVLLFAVASEGFRIGGVNPSFPDELCGEELDRLGFTDPETFDSDELWNWEVGAKTSWYDGRLIANGTLFWIDWDNIQQRLQLECGFPLRGNAGEARSRGAELELTMKPTSRLDFSVGVGYTDAVITETTPQLEAEVGDRVQQIPEWTFSTSAQYTFPIVNDYTGYIRGDLQHVSDSFQTFDQEDPVRRREPYTLVNARFGVIMGRWEAMVFAENLTDEQANLSPTISLGAEVPGRPRIAINRPRTIGGEVRVRF